LIFFFFSFYPQPLALDVGQQRHLISLHRERPLNQVR